ncbi:MAG: hypothetical protein ACOC9B_02055 [Chloroflexota bacterium]
MPGGNAESNEERTFVRNERAGSLFETFLVAAVASVLVIRLYLAFAYRYLVPLAPVTGQVVVGPFHLAHMVWGGLLMLAGFIILFAFLGRSADNMGATVGGIGFGAFIDSVGKVITLDNDYFYQPVFAIIYIVFVALFLALRFVQRPGPLTTRAALVNALEYAQQAVLGDQDSEERLRTMSLLDRQDPQHPFVTPLRRIVEQAHGTPSRRHGFFARTQQRVRDWYQWLVRKAWFTYVLVGLFVLYSVNSLYQTLADVRWSAFLIAIFIVGAVGAILLASERFGRRVSTRTMRTITVLLIAILVSWGILLHMEQPPASIVHWVQLVAPIISSILVMFGALLIWRSRLQAYRMFHLALLVSILITQVFAFYEEQLVAAAGLFLQLPVLVALRFMIKREEIEAAATATASNGVTRSSSHGR